MAVAMQQTRTNNYCLLSLTAGATVVCSGSKDSVSKQIFEAGKINIDKWSVWNIQWLYVIWKNKNSQIEEKIDQNIEHLPSLLL